MIVSDHFLFVHLHKSGGTFVNQLMLNCMPSARRLGYHLPYSEVPADYRMLPVLGTVRNPWAYYVSWYFFQRGMVQPNALFSICSDGGSLGFADTARNLASLHGDHERIARLSDAVPDHFVGAGLNLTKSCVNRLAGSGLGFYSFLYQRMYEGAEDLRLIRAESLRADLSDALVRLEGSLTPLTEMFIARAPALNRSEHEPFRDYYDASLRDFIGSAERPVIEYHAYRFH